jgi:hypothetical protein
MMNKIKPTNPNASLKIANVFAEDSIFNLADLNTGTVIAITVPDLLRRNVTPHRDGVLHADGLAADFAFTTRAFEVSKGKL